ncbi:MAG: hypothetical protein IJA62_03815 [Ruminococcus sp.]|nr:hypothetical protein [Ruminococcus sp.]
MMEKKELLAQKLMESANENGEFFRAFVSAEDASDVQKVLNDNGFDATVEEIEELFSEGLKEILDFKDKASEEELSEEQLDDVDGGGFLRGTARTVISAAAGFGFGAFCAVCPAASAATPYVAGGLTAWSVAGYKKKSKKKK